MLYWIIIGICIAEFVFNVILQILNNKAAKFPIPKVLQGIYDDNAYQRQQSYRNENVKINFISSCIDTMVLISLFAFGGFALFDEWGHQTSSYPIIISLVFFGLVFICSWILGIPANIYRTFVIEERYGFNRTTPKIFILDTIKGLFITIIIGGGIIALLVWIYGLIPQYFWIIAWSVLTLIMLFMQFFYSDLIVPLFNKQTPLEEGELRIAIEAFAQKADFKIKNIYVINGSKRSAHANAYFTGYGSRKRIVLYDTLMEQLTTEEIVGVLAHEIGHYKHGHIYQGLISSSITNLVMFFIFGLVIDSPQIAEAAGNCQPSFHINIMVFSLLYSPFSTMLSIIDNVISRHHEWQADEFARKHNLGKAVSEALKKMSAKSLANLTPHPFVVFIEHSHPTLKDRVIHLEEKL